MKTFIALIVSLCKMLFVFIIWLCLCIAINVGITQLQEEHYAPTDTPNPKFSVVTTPDGQTQIQTWQEYTRHPNPLLITPDPDCTESCLKKLDNGNYQYHNDAPLMMTFSEYRIENNRAIAVSFYQYHFGHMLLSMILSFVMVKILSYFYKHHQYRHDKARLKAYHQQIIKNILILVGFLCVMAFVVMMSNQ